MQVGTQWIIKFNCSLIVQVVFQPQYRWQDKLFSWTWLCVCLDSLDNLPKVSRWLTLLVNAGGSYSAYSLQERCLTTSRQMIIIGASLSCCCGIAQHDMAKREGRVYARPYVLRVCNSFPECCCTLCRKCEKGFVWCDRWENWPTWKNGDTNKEHIFTHTVLQDIARYFTRYLLVTRGKHMTIFSVSYRSWSLLPQ